jgi:predicted TIM-barrel fold metal-dependent hydrolase
VTITVDSHCHVFDTARFPYAADAAYRPPPAEQGTAGQFAALLDANGVTHALLVNPTSGYGYDNRCMVAALRASNGRFRGIARVRPGIADADLASLADAGVIGIRLDLISDGVALLEHPAIGDLFAQVRALRWQVHVQCEKDQLAQAMSVLLGAEVPLVVDHCGRPDVARGPAQPGFQALLQLGREGHAVKLSGPFRFSSRPSPYGDVVPFIDALLDIFTPVRCVWGSDWPFLRLQDRPDYGSVLALLRRWLPDDDARRQVMGDTPSRLFGF